MIDRQAGELSKKSLKFYKQFLKFFIQHCDANSLKQIGEVTPDFLRRYLLGFSETHNPGGVHAAYRTLRAFFRWITEEKIMPPDWKNPMQKVKAPKVSIDPLESISLEDVRKLIDTCQPGSFTGERDGNPPLVARQVSHYLLANLYPCGLPASNRPPALELPPCQGVARQNESTTSWMKDAQVLYPKFCFSFLRASRQHTVLFSQGTLKDDQF